MSKAGFINGTYTCATTVSQATSPTNPYGQSLELVYDANYAVATGTATNRHNLKTGGQIPSDILGEIDRKVDDGNALARLVPRADRRRRRSRPPNCYDAAPGVWVTTIAGRELRRRELVLTNGEGATIRATSSGPFLFRRVSGIARCDKGLRLPRTGHEGGVLLYCAA